MPLPLAVSARVARLDTSTKLKIGYGALAVADTWLSGRGTPRAEKFRRVTKPLLMPTLAASLLLDERASGSPLRTSTAMALAGGWGGDLALLGDDTAAFAKGMGLFGLGHAAYITGFHRARSATPVSQSRSGRAAAAALVATGPVMAIAAGRKTRVLGPATLGYSAALSAMVAHAGSLGAQISPAGRAWTTMGAALFMASDSMLGARKFLMSDPPHALERAVMATYTAAQFCLAQGAARA